MANRKLVVKVGTSTLTDGSGRIDRSYVLDLTSQLADLQQDGWDVALVTSGAIRAGTEAIDLRAAEANASITHVQHRTALAALASDTAGSLPYKQAAAAIGQSRLMHTYTEAFAWRNLDCAQILLTRDDFGDPRREENARNTLLTLLTMRVIPVINENDTVAVDEIRLGDNDNLAALVAVLIKADLLLILSDVEGLYSDPAAALKRGAGTPVPVVEKVDEAILGLAGGSSGSVGTGGMRTKVEAARLATESGIVTVIAHGRLKNVVTCVAAGGTVGTTFLAQ